MGGFWCSFQSTVRQPLAVAAYLTDHVVPVLIGRDARRIEHIWQLLYEGACTAPGLGVDIDVALAATFPYPRAYLPVARLMDGTVHDW